GWFDPFFALLALAQAPSKYHFDGLGEPPGVIAYIARNGAIGFLDRVPPRGHLCAPGGRVGRSVAAQTEGADHARPFRSRAWRAWRGAGDGRDAGDHGSALRAAEWAGAGL